MIRAGHTIARDDGERLTFRRTGHETDGELLEIEAVYRPHSSPPPAHYHPLQEERFEVLDGALRARIGAHEQTYRAGDVFTVPRGAHHWMHNASDEETRVLWQIRPALGSAELLHALWTLPDERRNLLGVAGILHAHPREFRLARPPYLVQRALFAVLGPLGRMLGYGRRAS